MNRVSTQPTRFVLKGSHIIQLYEDMEARITRRQELPESAFLNTEITLPIHIEQAFYTAAFSWRYLFPGGTRTGQKNVLWLRSGIKGPLLLGLSPSSSTAWSRA